MDTTGRSGKMSKSATVHTNDKKHPQVKLTMTGMVEKFASITPKRVKLAGGIDQPIISSVTIVPKEKYPFKILESKAKNGKDIRFRIEEVKKEKGPGYLLTVENIRKEKGRYFDTISLKTDSKVKSELSISVYGNISEEKKNAEK